jgi:hypothetical protein
MEDLSYIQEHRHAWLRDTIEVYGFVNFKHVMRKFKVSKSTAILTLESAFEKTPPSTIKYDPRLKAYIKPELLNQKEN